jgi:RNA polymerase sigma-70 factor (ECF subfamily)
MSDFPYQSDAECIAAYRAGDPAAFEALVARHLSAVYNFIARYAGGGDDADDIVQDVFVKVWKHLHRFDTTKNFRTWLFTIAKNTALDWLKKKKAIVFSDMSDGSENMPAFEETIADDEPAPPEIIDAKISHTELASLLDGLHPDHKAVVLLRLDSQLTFREIAESLDRPINTVKSHYRRAISSLRKKLDDSHQTSDTKRIRINHEK